MSDRKYRHRGYQDDDDRDRQPKQRRPAGGNRFDGAPRGRGLGAPTAVAFKCARCGKQVAPGDVEPDTSCPACGSPLHTCTNCTFFDTGSRFECRKEIPARIESKGKANDCSLFQPKAVRELRAKEAAASPSDPRAAFDALFKK